MRLVSLELIGFKSFHEKTTISFPEGFCAIVGPNGCGKSNIVDAILWVLGAQSPKLLRGEKMTDVIFSGSKTKKKAHLAEVTLQFDNQDRLLPIQANEVSVGRRIFRTGESEYFLNRQPVRMRDVQELFATTGLGKEGFSVIGQGQVDAFLMKSPEEKRKLIEEIAGIHRFFEKKKEAELHLKSSQVNIQRAGDVHVEVQKQLEKLENQKKALEEYKKAEEVLFFDKKEYEEKKLSLMRAALDQKQKKAKESEETVKEIFLNESQCESKIRTVTDSSRLFYREKDFLAEKFQEVKAQKALYQQAEKNLMQRKEESFQQLTQAKKRSELLDETLQEILKQSNEIILKENVLSQKLKAKEELVPKKEQQVTLVEEDLRKKETVTLSLKSELQASETHWKNCFAKKELAYQEREVLLRKKKASLEGKQAHEASFHKEEETALEMAGSKKKLIQELEKEKEFLEKQKKELAISEKKFFECEIQVKETGQKRAHLQAEIHAFQIVQKQLIESQKTLKSILDENKKTKILKNACLLVDWLEKEKCEVTPETLCMLDAKYSSTLVLETVEDARKLLSWNKQKVSGSLSFLVQEMCHGGSLGFLSSLKQLQSSDDPFLEKKAEEGYFTSSGLFRDTMGVFFFSSQETGLFSNARELKVKQSKFEELLHLEADLQRSFQENKISLHALKQVIEVKEHEMRKNDMRLVEISMKLTHSESHKAFLQERLNHTSQIVRECEEDLKKVEKRFSEYEEEISSFQEKRRQMQLTFDEMKKEQETVSHSFLEIKQSYRALQNEILGEKEALFKIESSKKLLEQKCEHVEQEKKVLASSLHTLQEALVDFEKKREVLLQDSMASSKAGEGLIEQLEEIKKKINECEIKKKDLSQELLKIKEKKELALLKKTQLNTSLEIEKGRFLELSSSFTQTYGASSFSNICSERELDHLLSSIQARSEWLKAHQTINLNALQEYEECRSRFESTEVQLRDLNESYEQICTLIKRLEQESAFLFQETLKILESYFSMNFAHLFPGGYARLLEVPLSDDGRGGVELVVELPGKESQSLKMMSGGERCLTALAFLFALFQARKAPLCLLDEVDAPLDEANVERFCSLLDSCGSTHFLIVTHNKQTMEKASSLLGVTMPEKGVSKILQVAFTKRGSAL